MINIETMARALFTRAAEVRDGDGDGYVNDGTPQERPVTHDRDEEGRFADRVRFGNRKERSHRARVSYSHNIPELAEINDYDWESQPTSYEDPEWAVRDAMLEKLDAIAQDTLTESANGFAQLDDAEQEARREVTQRILRMCPIRMKLRILHNIGDVHHHQDADAVTRQHMKNYKKTEEEIAEVLATDKRVGGFWSFSVNTRENGSLHLGTGYELPSGNRSAKSAKEIYAHEIGHALDGKREFSKSEDWHIAWSTELASGDLTQYAGTSPEEGFAEYFERMNSDPKDARRSFPMCWKFFSERFAQ